MGAWGTGIYDNDDAADWAAGIAEGLDYVRSALEEIPDGDEFFDSWQGLSALVAADVVARLSGSAGEDTPYAEDVAAWVQSNAGLKPSPDTIQLARRAVQRVGTAEGSEARMLWAETDDFATWQKTLDDLLQRLERPSADSAEASSE